MSNKTSKLINESIKEKLSQIPDKMLESFTKRAIRDAESIMNANDENIEELTYTLYRAYCIGFVIGHSSK